VVMKGFYGPTEGRRAKSDPGTAPGLVGSDLRLGI